MAENNFEISEAELGKRLTVYITIRRSRIFRGRWLLFLGLLKLLAIICPYKLVISCSEGAIMETIDTKTPIE